MCSSLNNLNNDVATGLWCSNSDRAAGWGSSLLLNDWLEDTAGLVVGDGEDTDGGRKVLEGGDGWVGSLVDLLGLVELDEGSLKSGTTGGELRWVDGGGGGGWGEDLGGLWEDELEVVGDLWGVGGSTGEDHLVDIENVEAGLLNGLLNEAIEAIEDLAADGLVAQTVDGGGEVDTLSKGLDRKGGVGSDGESLLAGLALGLELGKGTSLGAWVGGVPLNELLGEVIHQDLVEVAAGKVVVVGGGEDGVDAATGRDNGDVRASSTEVGNNNKLIGDLSVWASIICKESSDWLSNQLENINAGFLGGGSDGSLLLVGEVGWDGNNSGVNSVSGKVGCGLDETLEKTRSGLLDGDSGLVSLLLVLDAEGDGVIVLLWVCGGVRVGWVYRLEPSEC